MQTTDKLFQLICSFVEKSGGLEKVEQGAKGLRAVANQGPNAIQKFVQGVAAKPEGAKQLCAAALLGFSVAAAIYRGRKGTADGKAAIQPDTA